VLCVRRYADVVVHRLLSAALGLIQLPAQVRLTCDSDIWSMQFTNLNLMPKHLKVHDLPPSPGLLVTQSHEDASHGRLPQRLAALCTPAASRPAAGLQCSSCILVSGRMGLVFELLLQAMHSSSKILVL